MPIHREVNPQCINTALGDLTKNNWHLLQIEMQWWNRKTTWGDRFREHLHDVERNENDASKPVVRHFNLLNHSKQYMEVCGLSLNLGSSESRKTLQQKFSFQIGALNLMGINERFSFYWFIRGFSRYHVPNNSVAPLSAYKRTHNPQFLHSLWRVANAPNVSFLTLYGG